MASRRRKAHKRPTQREYPPAHIKDGLLIVPSLSAGTSVRLEADILDWFDAHPEATKREITEHFNCSRAAAKTLKLLWQQSAENGHVGSVVLPEGVEGCATAGADAAPAKEPEPAATEAKDEDDDKSQDNGGESNTGSKSNKSGEDLVFHSFEDLAQLTST